MSCSPSGGIYVHIPYCRHHCFYCDFNVAVVRRIPQRDYTNALLHELAFRGPQLGGPARSLYFGGGTPSLWDPALLGEVIASARRSPGLHVDAEITLEANPDEVEPDRLARWREAGINRLSVGIQALRDGLLRGIDRSHTAADVFRAVSWVEEAGFKTYSIDLMFGLPGQSVTAWEEDLMRLIGLGIPHLSLYGLTVEPRTGLAARVARQQVCLPDDEQHLRMLFAARDTLRAAGYLHYEVSTYCREGHHAIHNTGYWDFRPYLGLGAGANGFIAPTRWENVRSHKRYIQAAHQGDPTGTVETLDPQTLAFERLMVGLRRLDVGVDLGEDFGRFETEIRRQVDKGWLTLKGSRITVTGEGLRWTNAILRAFVPD